MPYGYPPPPPVVESMEGFHTHDGFYMRVHVGIAATGFSSTQAGVKTNYAGGGSSTGIAIGGVIARNLILYGAVFGTRHLEPRQAGRRRQHDRATSAASASAPLVPGIAYYFEHMQPLPVGGVRPGRVHRRTTATASEGRFVEVGRRRSS